MERGKQFGLVVIKPEGMMCDLDIITAALLNGDYNPETLTSLNPIVNWVLQSYKGKKAETVRKFLPLLRKELTLHRDTTHNDELWRINYASHKTGHYHDDVMNLVRGKNALFFTSITSEYPIEEVLKLLKGVTTLVPPDRFKNDLDPITRVGYGVRGLQTKEAAYLSQEELRILINMSGTKESFADEVANLPPIFLRTSLSRNLQRLIFPYAHAGDNYNLISDGIHSSDNSKVVLDSLVAICGIDRKHDVSGQVDYNQEISTILTSLRLSQ